MKRNYPIFIKIAKHPRGKKGYKVEARTHKTNNPIIRDSWYKEPLPTLQFKINVQIDDREFDEVKRELDLVLENLEPSIEIKEEKENGLQNTGQEE